MLVVAIAAALPVACGEAGGGQNTAASPTARAATPTSTPTSLGQAFEAAHPTGALPPGLQARRVGQAEVARRVATVAPDADVVLPTWLPDGFGLAAPYVAVGDGSVRPNPEGWRHSYRVSYTDGKRLLVLTVGAGRRPVGFELRRLDARLGDRQLLGARTGTTAVVVTARRPLIELRGEGLELAPVVRVVRNMTRCD